VDESQGSVAAPPGEGIAEGREAHNRDEQRGIARNQQQDAAGALALASELLALSQRLGGGNPGRVHTNALHLKPADGDLHGGRGRRR